MNGDISRVTFNPLKHFTSVLSQQGRVQIDADWNEQSSILLYYLRGLAADLIGQHGGPDDFFNNQAARTGMLARNCGFGIVGAKRDDANTINFLPSAEMLQSERELLNTMPTNQVPLMITAGHYYVDGLLCENENFLRYSQQPYREQANDDELRNLNGVSFVYLDVWERLITSLEDSSIRDVALGGADTGARTKLTWQVRISPAEQIPDPIPACNQFNRQWSPGALSNLQNLNRGRLSAKAREPGPGAEANPCITSPESRYRGMENQLYRVEIHQGGPPLNTTGGNQDEAATFKWSRDNATVVASLKRKEGERLIVSGLRDFSRWFAVGNWVEITHDALELNGLPGTLVRLSRVEGETLTIDPFTTSGTIYEPGTRFQGLPITNLKVRRWDQKQPEDGLLKEGALLIEENEWIELEDGVEIKFEPEQVGRKYRTGDYWLIPARVATGNVEWPQAPVPDPINSNNFQTDPDDPTKFLMGPKPLRPHGVVHHYAPLALVRFDNGQPGKIVDLRHKFLPLGIC